MKPNRTIEVFKILLHHSNEQNPISMNEILEKLKGAGLKANRKSVYNDFKLIDLQTPCEVIQTKGARASYFLSDSVFEISEIRLLIDAIQCSKFISTSKSESLIRKFKRFISVHDEEMLKGQIALEGRNKTSNTQLFNNVDEIYRAIGSGRMISFQYFDYNWNREKKLRKDGRRYNVYPQFLTWEENKYFLVCYTQNKKGISHYRVDRMLDVQSGKIDLSYNAPSIDIAVYSKEVVNMFSGSEKRQIVLCVDNSDGKMINQVFDQFGDGIEFSLTKKAEWYRCTVDVYIAITLFGWISHYKGKIQIIGPEEVKSQYVDFLKCNLQSACSSELKENDCELHGNGL